ncbi:hypothetical protein CUMW_194150 [Citrus unshiu]|nr:hypothetical protein CUMW_194150 [Citrus unshiu]
MHKSDDVQPPKINSLIVPVPDVQEYCEDKLDGSQALKEKIDEDTIKKLVDVEKHMFMAVAPDPDITIRSSVFEVAKFFLSLLVLPVDNASFKGMLCYGELYVICGLYIPLPILFFVFLLIDSIANLEDDKD